MKKRRFVSTIFAAIASFVASAATFTPVDNSLTFYKEGSSGEQIFVGDADSANITLTSDKAGVISNVQLISGATTTKVTGTTIKIGTDKCYTVSYTVKGNDETESTESAYLCYVQKKAMAPTVKVCDYDSITNPVCDPELRVKFLNLDYPNSYVNSRNETVKIKDNIVITYIDYEANGTTIKEKPMEIVVEGVNDDTTLLIPKPKRHTVFKLKDKLSSYEYITDTFHTSLPFMSAQLTIDAEAIPHNTEKRNDEALVFGTKDDAKTNAGNYVFSGPLEINLERNCVDNTSADTIDALYIWRFYNDSTGTFRVPSYNTIYNDLSRTAEPINDFGTYFIVLTCDNGVCKDTLVTGFKVKSSYLTMPYVFSPNGDGINDEFRPTYTSISEYKIWIYNTMGKKMYESEDITVGWDGTHKGNEAPIGAYYYVVEAKGVDGINYKLKGTVNLVRNAKD